MVSRREFLAAARLPPLAVAGAVQTEVARPHGVKKIRITGVRAVSYTHLTLPTNREV